MFRRWIGVCLLICVIHYGLELITLDMIESWLRDILESMQRHRELNLAPGEAVA